MPSATDRILREVLALPVDERADLFRRLKQALPRESTPAEAVEPMADAIRKAWVDEALDRLERHDRGEAGNAQSIDEVEKLLSDSLRSA